MAAFAYSLLVLTYNRNHLLAMLARELEHFSQDGAEVIVVDNFSDQPATDVTGEFPWIINLRAPSNLGAAGRNLGFQAATGDIVICLDDDIAELSADAMERLDALFSDPRVAAVNFKVVDQETRQIVNWVHHREVEHFGDKTFDTYEITEGAVALRRAALKTSGGYPESFFLSHEGPDLAFRLMNDGFRVTYSPLVSVVHSFATEGRTSWRNYYFDTRNTLWLATRNLPWTYGTRVVLRQTISMLIYAIRDGYGRWWLKGLIDGVRGIRRELKDRKCLTREAFARVRAIDKYRPSLIYVIRKRLPRRDLKF